MKQRILLTVIALIVSACVNAGTVDCGFRHPGGLHTEADFIRIKKQLAEGDSAVTAAWKKLITSQYSQAGVATYPVETVVRGGSGENYINAARGAAMAYQNALRWRITGSKSNADAAVRILNAWASTTTRVTGDSNYALATGIYGYQFAQAAELMRDYEGWQRADFAAFQEWMLDVWYPGAISFLCGRNGTWENKGKWWRAPGHYWSNWGLCNALCVISIGVLCDSVAIYNQGVSFIKHDQTKTWLDNTGEVVYGHGLNEYLGYLIPAVSADSRGPYGELGQMQESGRDQGHATMSLGLAVDIAETLWNQGNDLYHFMNHRLAAGAEWCAAYNNALIDDLPWKPFHYYTNGFYWTDSRSNLMTGPSSASRGQTRAYWARIVGHYEGIMGVKMQYSRKAMQQMGIDGGGTGSTSGAYDHLGFSVLTCTRDMACADSVPTLLSPEIITESETLCQSELGALVNNYTTDPMASVCLTPGTRLILNPCLPSGEEDTGKWEWNTGEKTRQIAVAPMKSYIYRATYTNSRGVKSEIAFSIAVASPQSGIVTAVGVTKGDCEEPAFYNLLGQRVGRQANCVLVSNGRKIVLRD